MQGENHVVILKDNEIVETSIEPEKYGFSIVKTKRLEAGIRKKMQRLRSSIKRRKSVYRDTVLFNAGLALFANGKAKTIEEGITLAAHSIDSGKALAKLSLLIAASNEKLERVN